MVHLTFKQYLESRAQLLKAIENTPIAVLEYDIRKYCTIQVGESEDEKQLISLKPKNKLIVEWSYEDINDPEPISVRLSTNESFDVFWSGEKMKKWLVRHASKGIETI
jgi:hypothetical protein